MLRPKCIRRRLPRPCGLGRRRPPRRRQARSLRQLPAVADDPERRLENQQTGPIHYHLHFTLSGSVPFGPRARQSALPPRLAADSGCRRNRISTPDHRNIEEERAMRYSIEPISRRIEIVYPVPETAGNEPVVVHCSWRRRGRAGSWQPARVQPQLSDTALDLTTPEQWEKWMDGIVLEHRAAGLERTLLFNPYPEAQSEDGRVDIDFRVRLETPGGRMLGEHIARIEADNSDVVYLHDWSCVLQKQAVTTGDSPGRWRLEQGLPSAAPPYATAGRRLFGPGGQDLPQLTYPLNLKGMYAVFVYAFGNVRLRFSGEERCDRLGSTQPFREELWQWRRMDHQHLVIRQNYDFTGPAESALDYVKLVPITPESVARLEARFGKPDRFVAAYWEPYSHAFADNVQDACWHRRRLSAYKEAAVSLVDTQLGRFGMKMVFESRIADQLLYQTIGDPIGSIRRPETSNVGRMQQYTNTLESTLKFGGELGLKVHANFGAGNCYPGSPLQGDFSRKHPEWMRGAALRFEVPEVREFALALYRETLEIGAPGLSIDFCRYPETIDSTETANAFLRELRTLADEFAGNRGTPVPILVRFPARGVRRWEYFDYTAWARNGWVDYLCPSNLQGRFQYFDVTPYLEAVRGARCTLLPVIDALGWGLPMPGLFLWRVNQLYQKGVPGVYIYQADAPILGSPRRRRIVRLLRSAAAVARFIEESARRRARCSKGIYISHPLHPPAYHPWEQIHIWLEGIPWRAVEIHLDGRQIQRFAGPPYFLESQDANGNPLIPPGDHALRICARDRNGWFEQTFRVSMAG